MSALGAPRAMRVMERKTKVGDWMTPKPITIEEDSTVIQAIRLLKEKGFRRVPVMRKGRLAGVLTERMLLSFSPGKSTPLDMWEVHYTLALTPVRDVMNPNPHTVLPDTPLAEAARLLHDRKLNGVLVVDERKDLVGIFTTTNALEALIHFAAQRG
jgi:acetoin utilization protein AcuB